MNKCFLILKKVFNYLTFYQIKLPGILSRYKQNQRDPFQTGGLDFN